MSEGNEKSGWCIGVTAVVAIVLAFWITSIIVLPIEGVLDAIIGMILLLALAFGLWWLLQKLCAMIGGQRKTHESKASDHSAHDTAAAVGGAAASAATAQSKPVKHHPVEEAIETEMASLDSKTEHVGEELAEEAAAKQKAADGVSTDASAKTKTAKAAVKDSAKAAKAEVAEVAEVVSAKTKAAKAAVKDGAKAAKAEVAEVAEVASAKAKAAKAAVKDSAKAAKAEVAEVAGAAGAKAEAAKAAVKGSAKATKAEAVETSVEEARAQAGLLDKPRAGGADDLKMIKGVGPKFEKLCNDNGIFHFDQIAKWVEKDIDFVDSLLSGFHGRIKRDNWVAQAKILAEGGETEFSRRVEDGDVY